MNSALWISMSPLKVLAIRMMITMCAGGWVIDSGLGFLNSGDAWWMWASEWRCMYIVSSRAVKEVEGGESKEVAERKRGGLE